MKHILIIGARGAGKSTLIAKIMANLARPVSGFLTRPCKSTDTGLRTFHIYPADCRSFSPTEDNKIGESDGQNRRCFPDAFNRLGIRYLSAKPGHVVIMDEIGDMETAAPAFCREILKCLDSSIPVIAAVKDKPDNEFISAVLSHPRADVYRITDQNRDALSEMLIQQIRKI